MAGDRAESLLTEVFQRATCDGEADRGAREITADWVSNLRLAARELRIVRTYLHAGALTTAELPDRLLDYAEALEAAFRV